MPPKHETFRIRGYDHIYDCILDAIQDARVLGVGTVIIRVSDGQRVVVVPKREGSTYSRAPKTSKPIQKKS